MVIKIAKENHLWLIQVFQNGFQEKPTLKYRLKEYDVNEGLLNIIDPRINLTKSFPTSICTIDEVKE
jgi:hypothetical protein